MVKSVPYPSTVKDEATRKALIGLTNNRPVNHADIEDVDVRRIVVALKQRNKGASVSIPSPSTVKDINVRRILQKLI